MERGSLELGGRGPGRADQEKDARDRGRRGNGGGREPGYPGTETGAGEPRKPRRTDRGHVKSDVIRGPLSLGARSAPVPAILLKCGKRGPGC